MRKDDLTAAALLLEAVNIILTLVYIGLQIFYGVTYGISPYKLIINLLIVLLVYAGFTVLSFFPERLNRIPAEMCTGDVRKYSLKMIRLIKFVFIAGLLVPCVFDAAGIGIQSAYSLIVIGIIIVIAVFYEYKIIKILRKS